MAVFKLVNRRDFLKLSSDVAAGAFVFATFGTAACGQSLHSSEPAQKPLGGADGELKSSIGNNHGHAFVVSLADLRANGEKIYNILGQSNHGHDLQITKVILDTLEATKIVDVESSEVGFHSHIVRLEII